MNTVYSPPCRSRSEQSAGRPVYSKESTSVNNRCQPTHSEPNFPGQCVSQWKCSKDGDEKDKYKQDKAAAQDIQDALTKDVQSVHAGPEYLFCTETKDGEESSGRLALITTSTQSQTPKAPRETLHLEEGSTLETSGGLNKNKLQSEQMKLNDVKHDLMNDSSSQTRMTLQGSTVIFSEESSYYRSSGEVVVPPPTSQASNLTFNPSQVCTHAITETPGDREAREGSAPSPWSSVQNSESDPTQPCPPSVQSIDCLPTFTSQRPQDLPTTMGKRAVSNTWNTTNTTQYEYRYVCNR